MALSGVAVLIHERAPEERARRASTFGTTGRSIVAGRPLGPGDAREPDVTGRPYAGGAYSDAT
jgi:hypothetical protein